MALDEGEYKGPGWYSIDFSDGGQSWTNDGPLWFDSESEFDREMEAASATSNENHLPYATFLGGTTMTLSSGLYEYNESQFRKETIELLWKEFADVCVDDNDCIDSSFCGWEFGTNRNEIWHWFDAQYARYTKSGAGLAVLMGIEEIL